MNKVVKIFIGIFVAVAVMVAGFIGFCVVMDEDDMDLM